MSFYVVVFAGPESQGGKDALKVDQAFNPILAFLDVPAPDCVPLNSPVFCNYCRPYLQPVRSTPHCVYVYNPLAIQVLTVPSPAGH